MPGLDPGIHAVPQAQMPGFSTSGAAWMAGSSPAMTILGCSGPNHYHVEAVRNFNRIAVVWAGLLDHKPKLTLRLQAGSP